MNETEKYLENIKKRFDLNNLKQLVEKLKEIKVLIIGDTIIDKYVFVQPKGRAVKDPILSVEFINEESYAGGILAIANHISTFVDNIKLVTLLGDKKSKSEFIKKNIDPKIELKFFTKENAPTTLKKRYIDSYRKNKLFKMEKINDKPISESLTKEITDYLNNELEKFDLIIVGDFGHGFINGKIRHVLEEKSKFLSINVQTNSSNMGYNYITNYKRAEFISMNESELRLPLMKRFDDVDTIIKEFHKKFKYNKFLVTLGKNGSVLFDDAKIYKAPILIKTVVDTVGSGDASFAISSLFSFLNVENELITFFSNCAGGIISNVSGNEESITKEKLLNFIGGLYQNGLV